MKGFQQLKFEAAIEFDQLWPKTFPAPTPEAKDIVCDFMAAFAYGQLIRESIKQAQAEVGKPHGGSLS